MKTPDEIKMGLAMCTHGADCGQCPYTLYECSKNQMEQDALAYIQQLEAERDALMHWARGRCDTCDHNGDCVGHEPDPEGYIVHWYDDCEAWEWRGVKEEG